VTACLYYHHLLLHRHHHNKLRSFGQLSWLPQLLLSQFTINRIDVAISNPSTLYASISGILTNPYNPTQSYVVVVIAAVFTAVIIIFIVVCTNIVDGVIVVISMSSFSVST
jgi:hypothetical protein